MKKYISLSLLVIFCATRLNAAQPVKENLEKNPWNSTTFSGLTFRSIGPALTSGRVVDFAVNPDNKDEYYVASASGGVWKTTNNGITYEPVFDAEGSYSIGCITMDPANHNVVWVGSGENNNQRSVAYGDGVYKTEDGGKTWKNTGLKNSEHIGMIAVDPTNTDIVYVAAYGPLWSAGGDRGIYKTTDGGKTWNAILTISENTGCNEIHLDPRNPRVLYATAHQRRRQVFTYISGGPESAIYKSTDAGATWSKLTNGLPDVDLGRIGLAISPVNPDVLFAIIEASDGKGGVFRSDDRGASWVKQCDNTTAGNYYQEIFCDPRDINKVYYMDFWVMVSKNGGKSFEKIGEKYKHVDNHALWIDPASTGHLLVGCDGGIYETRDDGANWQFKANLPVTQFYKLDVDHDKPFYNVYGGTQDNNSLGGPSRTTSSNGITNSDWKSILEGDGFQPQCDPENPDIVYAQYQYGGLVRFDRKSGEVTDIHPYEAEGEKALRWNWDSPLLISHHNHTQLYFGSNKLYRSDDMGNSWQLISPDLSRQLDRNKLPVMGRVWSMDAVAKNSSTDYYGNLVTIAESYFDENNLMVGTDDGLIQITSDGGKNWKKIDNIPGVPERTYVNQIIASHHDRNTWYVAFNHHRYGNFKPYLFRTTDGGLTWKAIQNDLPERGSVYTIAEDYINKNLLFAGTEFGVFFSVDGGNHWVQLKGGMPVIAVRDMVIQQDEDDLVLATFGRGIYILDDYSPLRELKSGDLDKEALLFPEKKSWLFNETRYWGAPLKGFQGESFFSVPNPPVGETFTWYLRDDIKTIKEKRKASEKEKIKKGEPVFYPSADSIRLEDEEPTPYLLFTVTSASGDVIRKLKAPVKKGLNRIAWDFRYASPGPVSFAVPDPTNPYDVPETGYPVLPGKYQVSLSKFEDGKITSLVQPVSFEVQSLNAASLPAQDKKALEDFCSRVSEVRREVSSADTYRSELVNRLKFIHAALLSAPGVTKDLTEDASLLDLRLKKINTALNGDASLSRREFETLPSIQSRIGAIEYSLWSASSAPTETFRQSLAIAEKEFSPVLTELKSVDDGIKKLEMKMETIHAPYTPGREPDWNRK